jgi:hypothetical protein
MQIKCAIYMILSIEELLEIYCKCRMMRSMEKLSSVLVTKDADLDR